MKKVLIILFLGIFLIGLVSSADYYIDAVNGNDDTGDGSFSNPWQTLKMVSTYTTGAPAGHVNLQPGDTVYLMSGVYDQIITIGGHNYVAYFSVDGTAANPITIKAYPGEHPILDSNYQGRVFHLEYSNYWVVDGLEVRNGWVKGIMLTQSNWVTITNVTVYDTDGDGGNNPAGIYIDLSYNVIVKDSTLYDNYEHTSLTNVDNAVNLVIFSDGAGEAQNGGNITIYNNLFYQTLPITDAHAGGCLKYKHASRDPNSYFEVYNNTFINCAGLHTISSGTPNTYVHHNLIIESESSGLKSRNSGGLTHQQNQLFEYNTIYGVSGFYIDPELDYRNTVFPDDPQNITFRNNIVYDIRSSYDKEHALALVNAYIDQTQYDAIIPEMNYSNNCYYNPNTEVMFAVAGDVYTFVQWQVLEGMGYDFDSVVADPLFMSTDPSSPNYLRPQSGSPCEGMGYYADQLPSASDVNSDGVVNVVDLVLTTFWQGKIDSDLDWSWYDHLDVNLDGSVNWGDVIDVLGSI